MKTAIILVLWLMLPSAFADGLNGLCQQDIEGSYIGTVGSFKTRINLFCVDPQRLMATICLQVTPDGNFSADAVSNLSIANIDGGQLILSNFLLGGDDRRAGSSKSMQTYFRIDLAQLEKGVISGYFMSSSAPDLRPLQATREVKFPKVVPLSKTPLLKENIVGTFATDIPSYDPKLGTNLIFDILLETPVVYLVDVKARMALHFDDGPAWDNSGLISIATAEGNGGEPDDKQLNYLRGAFIDADTVEFYQINPVLGLEGPYHGHRLLVPMEEPISESSDDDGQIRD